MDLAKLTRAREIITGRSRKTTTGASEEQEIAAAIVAIIATLADDVDVLGEREGGDSRVALAAGELAGQLRAATAKAQILHAATQGDPRDVQSRHTT